MRLRGPFADFELRRWGSRSSFDEASGARVRLIDRTDVSRLLRLLVREQGSLSLRALVEEGAFVSAMLDEHELIERVSDLIVRGAIEVFQFPREIMTSEEAVYAEVFEPEPQEVYEELDVRLWCDSEVDEWPDLSVEEEIEEWPDLSVRADNEDLNLGTKSEPETLGFDIPSEGDAA